MSLGLLTSNLRVLKNLKLKELQYDKVLGMMSSKIAQDDGDYSHITQRRTKCELLLLSMAVCGIEFCYAAETAFVTPTLLQIGVPVYYMTLIWCLSPLLGFFLVPLLGSMSDKCKWRLGRRRPFILLLSIGIILGLILVPHGEDIGLQLGDKFDPEIEGTNNETYVPPPATTSGHAQDLITNASPTLEYMVATTVASLQEYAHPFSVVFTVLGVVMLDFSCDSCQSPCRAYMLDVTVPEDHSSGLSTFTVLAGLGGALGYALGGINWGGTQLGDSIGSHVKVVFSLVLVIFVICVSMTLTSVREVPLGKLGLPKDLLQKATKKHMGDKYQKFTDEEEEDGSGAEQKSHIETHGRETYGTCEEIARARSENDIMQMKQLDHNGTAVPVGDTRVTSNHQKEVASGSPGTERATVSDVESAGMHEGYSHEGLPMASEVTLKMYLLSIIQLPRSLVFLCLTNLFCWMSLVCYSLYFTDFVGQAVFGGDPSAPRASPAHALYETGVRVGSLAMSLYSFSCSAYSLSIEKLVKLFGAKYVYIGSQLVYTVGSLILALCPHHVAVFLLSPTAGVMYATLFTMPYLLVAHYHSNDTFEELVEGQKRNSQVRGLGTDIALVSSMVFVAQFLLSLAMGAIVHATGTTVSVFISASVLSFCGAVTATQVLYLDL